MVEIQEKNYKHTCYVCGNEGFVRVGPNLYRCYRDTCVYRDTHNYGEEVKKKICYICGKEGETHIEVGNYRGFILYRCQNNYYCTSKFFNKKLKYFYTKEGVYKYLSLKQFRNTPQELLPPLEKLNNQELEELKKQELQDKLEYAKSANYKPTAKEGIILALQEKACKIDELATKLKISSSTVKSYITFTLKKEGYKIDHKIWGGVDFYKIGEIFEQDLPKKTIKIEEVKKEIFPPLKSNKELPKVGAIATIISLLQEGEYSLEELQEKSGASLSTVKTQVKYVLPKKLKVQENNGKYIIIKE
jgi:DNA-directed RNA polymerase specialized sigma24 family protein